MKSIIGLAIFTFDVETGVNLCTDIQYKISQIFLLRFLRKIFKSTLVLHRFGSAVVTKQ